jgi:anti-sigma factor RsiW
MKCAETEILLHALLDDELDAGHAREVEGHLMGCPRCAAQLDTYRKLQDAMLAAPLRYAAPAGLRHRIEGALPRRRVMLPGPGSRWSMLKGFAMGTVLSSAIAASLVIGVIKTDHDQQVLGEVVSAHVRSLQGAHLTDVQTSDQHTVKPWFNGKLDISPPVVDLTAQGFTLIGGRLDYLDGKSIASIVYQRRKHVINLFVTDAGTEPQRVKRDTMQGFNIVQWTASDLEFFAVSDINTQELQEFVDKFAAGFRPIKSVDQPIPGSK